MKRNGALDFLKVLATAILVMHHYTQDVYVSGKGFFYGGAFSWKLSDLFFTISGYLMYSYEQNAVNESVERFYFKRALRLLPMVAIAAIVFEIEVILYKHLTGMLIFKKYLDLSGTLFSMLGIQAGWASANPHINNPTWYISVLLLCYLWFYALNRYSNIKKIEVCSLYVVMILIGISIQSYKINMPFFNHYTARGYCSFFMGLLLAHFLDRYYYNEKFLTLISSFIVVFTAGIAMAYGFSGKHWYDNYWMVLVVFPALVSMTKSKTMIWIFRHRIWSETAKYAYNVYIWHVCLIVIWKYVLKIAPYLAQKEEWQMMVLFLLVAEIFGALSYHVIERPIVTAIKNHFPQLYHH